MILTPRAELSPILAKTTRRMKTTTNSTTCSSSNCSVTRRTSESKLLSSSSSQPWPVSPRSWPAAGPHWQARSSSHARHGSDSSRSRQTRSLQRLSFMPNTGSPASRVQRLTYVTLKVVISCMYTNEYDTCVLYYLCYEGYKLGRGVVSCYMQMFIPHVQKSITLLSLGFQT